MSEDTALLITSLDAIGVRFLAARHENTAIAMINAATPAMACKVVDWAIRGCRSGGTNNDVGLASADTTMSCAPPDPRRQLLERRS